MARDEGETLFATIAGSPDPRRGASYCGRKGTA